MFRSTVHNKKQNLLCGIRWGKQHKIYFWNRKTQLQESCRKLPPFARLFWFRRVVVNLCLIPGERKPSHPHMANFQRAFFSRERSWAPHLAEIFKNSKSSLMLEYTLLWFRPIEGAISPMMTHWCFKSSLTTWISVMEVRGRRSLLWFGESSC